jgi:hypothetical protein
MPSDATPAYKGYRLQALYTLSRILQPGIDNSLVFQPEGEEDLALWQTNALAEVCQVKAYNDNLALSHLSPEKPDSFFYRVHSLLKERPSLKVSLVSFGTVGPELQQALGSNAKESTRTTVARKLSAYGHISEKQAVELLTDVELVTVNETALTEQVYATLALSAAGIQPDRAFELLNHWLYACAEAKCQITYGDVIDRLNAVGRFVAERQAHHAEWFTTIVPIEDRDIEAVEHDELSASFYRGVSTRYDHILADLDVVRPARLGEIAAELETNRVVIVHGASGQGKTTLAYRFLHNYFPQMWRFQVKAVANRQHALSVAAALSSQADAMGVPIAVYLDVAPTDTDWPELVRQLSAHRSIRLLVTVREEDLRRATVSGADFEPAMVSLHFDQNEAEGIYASLAQKQVPTQFLSFEDAWRTFAGEGPLLEFVYLVTQGALLRERLSGQVTRLQEMVRNNELGSNELQLLRLVAVASAYEARLEVRPLVDNLGIAEPVRTLELLEGEYLLRRTAGGTLLGGLHPIRSAILSDLLTDPVFSSWAESASACLPFVSPPDVETFLLYSFSRHRTELEPLLAVLAAYRPDRWVAIGGVLRALLWLGIAEYVTANEQLIWDAIESKGEGWSLMLDYDLSDAVPGSGNSALSFFRSALPADRMAEIEGFRARQTDKGAVFVRVREWLTVQAQSMRRPEIDAEWLAAAEVVFWSGRLDIKCALPAQLTEEMLDEAVENLPLGVLADLILGLEQGHGRVFGSWHARCRNRLIERYRAATRTVLLEDDGSTLTAHFILAPEGVRDQREEGRPDDLAGPGESGGYTPEAAGRSSHLYRPVVQLSANRLHNETIQRMALLIRLIPDRDSYGCQGYGHRVWSDELTQPNDSTHKAGMTKSTFPPEWLTWVNATFQGLAMLSYRPATWEEHAQNIVARRKQVVGTLKSLTKALDAYFRKKSIVGAQFDFIGARGQSLLPVDEWNDFAVTLHKPVLLPRSGVDEWGVVREHQAHAVDDEGRQPIAVGRKGLLIAEYKAYLSAVTKYINALDTFAGQARQTMQLNPVLGKGLSSPENRAKVLEEAERINISPRAVPLSVVNLTEAVKTLLEMQVQFRGLLGRFLSEADLDRLDYEEARFLRSMWNTWYFFAFQPKRVLTSASVQSTDEVNKTVRQLRKGIERRLKKLSTDQISFTLLRRDVLWQRESALWILVDGTDAVSVYNCLVLLVTALRESLPKWEGNELSRYVIELEWPYVCIVPLVRGKALSTVAWRIYTPILLAEDNSMVGLKWWNYIPEQVPEQTWAQLGFSLWTIPQLEPAASMLQHTNALSVLVAHMRDLSKLTGELDDEGEALAQRYLSGVSGQVSELLQGAINAELQLIEMLKGIPVKERNESALLSAVVEGLEPWYEGILPTPEFESRATLAVADFVVWAGKLEKTCEYAFLVYLCWASYALGDFFP